MFELYKIINMNFGFNCFWICIYFICCGFMYGNIYKNILVFLFLDISILMFCFILKSKMKSNCI